MLLVVLLLRSVGRACLHASTIAGVADGNMVKDSMVADAGSVSTVILANGVAVMPFFLSTVVVGLRKTGGEASAFVPGNGLTNFADKINVPATELHNMTTPWPFSVWGMDVIGPITPKASNGNRFILVAIDSFTKWVEAASYASDPGEKPGKKRKTLWIFFFILSARTPAL